MPPACCPRPAISSSLGCARSSALTGVDPALVLQPLDRTTRLIGEAVGSGLDCSLTEEPCALQAGLAAEVDGVITARVERVADRLLLQLVLLDEGGKPPRRVVAVVDPPQKDSGASLRAAATRLLQGTGPSTPLPVLLDVTPKDATVTVDGQPGSAGVLWLAPGPHRVNVERVDFRAAVQDVVVVVDVRPGNLTVVLEPAGAAVATPSAGASMTVLAGIGIAGVGAVVVAGGTVGAVVVESALNGKMSFRERQDLQSAGVLCVLAIPVGLVIAGAGGVLGFVGASE